MFLSLKDMNLLKKTILFTIAILLFSFVNQSEYTCRATWYNTKIHPKIYRKHSTAAVSRNIITGLELKVGRINNGETKDGSYLIVTCISNNKVDTVEVTDVCQGSNKIDLCVESFEKLAKKSVGSVKVKVKKLQ